MVIRSAPRRARRFSAAAAGGVCAWVVVSVVVAGGRSAGGAGLDARFWSQVVAVAALGGVPAVLWAVYLGLQNRNCRIVVTGEGVELVDWRGRRRTVARPEAGSARRYHVVFRNSEGRDRYDTLVVVALAPTERPLLLWGTRWEWHTLEPLWSALGLEPADANDWKTPVSFAEVRADNAQLATPLWWRRPWTVTALALLGLSVYVGGWLALVLLLAA